MLFKCLLRDFFFNLISSGALLKFCYFWLSLYCRCIYGLGTLVIGKSRRIQGRCQFMHISKELFPASIHRYKLSIMLHFLWQYFNNLVCELACGQLLAVVSRLIDVSRRSLSCWFCRILCFVFLCVWIEWDDECCADMRAVMRLVKSVFNKMGICDFHLVWQT